MLPPPHTRPQGFGERFFPLGALRERPGSVRSLDAPSKTRRVVFDEGACSLKTLPKGSVQGARFRSGFEGGGGALPRSLGRAFAREEKDIFIQDALAEPSPRGLTHCRWNVSLY
jgi:hypothetical protein